MSVTCRNGISPSPPRPGRGTLLCVRSQWSCLTTRVIVPSCSLLPLPVVAMQHISRRAALVSRTILAITSTTLPHNRAMTESVRAFSINDEFGDQSSLSSRFDLAANYKATRESLGIDRDAPALPPHTGEFATRAEWQTSGVAEPTVTQMISAPLSKLDRFGDAAIRTVTDAEPSFEEPGNSVILTNKGEQASAVFLPQAIPAGQSFKATAKLLFRGTADCGFADGCALVLASTKGLGAEGGGAGLGFRGLGGNGDIAIANWSRTLLSA